MNYNPMNFNTTMGSVEQVEKVLSQPHKVKVSVRNQHVFIEHGDKITHVYRDELLSLGYAIYTAIMCELDAPHLNDDIDYLNSDLIFIDGDLYLNHATETAYI